MIGNVGLNIGKFIYSIKEYDQKISGPFPRKITTKQNKGTPI